ncbi:LysE family translocator [Alphaproteobacteria bacterium]|nr:LysE family translocator [Alphaproteobacteria bacterium]MDB4234242.1 LysE family translocator [Alphaproteobacteria bacterium]MDB9825027.1 LysE family translocator [Alphaproteobacteria bacterium]
MDTYTLISISFAAFIFGITPGPGTLAVLSVSTNQGFKSGIVLSAGEAIGDVMYLSIAILSLGYLAETLDPIMQIVRWGGAGYIIYLGIAQIRVNGLDIKNKYKRNSLIKTLLVGFVIGGTNPKVIVFYLSFIPLFIDLSSLNLFTGLQLIITIYLSVFFACFVVCVCGNQLRNMVENPIFSKRLNISTGMMMISVGIFLFLS